MASDATQLALVVGTAAVINVVAGVREGKDTVPTAVASGAYFLGLSVLGGLTNRWDIAIAFAWVFLIASLVMRGIPLIRTTTGLTSADTPRAAGLPTRSRGGTF